MFAQDIIPGTIGCLAGGAVTFALAMVFGFEGQEKMPLKRGGNVFNRKRVRRKTATASSPV